MDAINFVKEFAPRIGEEPFMTFRAKDDYSDVAVKAYRDALMKAGYEIESTEIMALDEWVRLRDQWREENPEHCKAPDF